MDAIDIIMIVVFVSIPFTFILGRIARLNDTSSREDRRRLECMKEHEAWKDVAKKRVG